MEIFRFYDVYFSQHEATTTLSLSFNETKYNKDFVAVTNFSIALKNVLTIVNGYTRKF